ncbi:antitermination regulator [Mycobacterium sp. 1245111.1]|uniref:GAF and ANTAR domain-containing protein n=1 Tax=Mycobacterium sp. 1245111.1 TaxID=1834073 RepID=UPI0007FD0763|nr:GAF and ANTAR domain-containing protein [Mycobacterium sp. 1245111.1]OBK34745.1 antitermination regulator [Mycobacterium sp. 1245111.1]
MPSRIRPDAARVFTSLADVVRRSDNPQEVYSAICVAATLTVPGCDHASLMVCRDGTCRTAGVSDDVARHVDRLELALGIGPCVETIESRGAQLESDLASSSRWPELTERVIAETPVRGAMSVRVPVDGAKIGALNVFSDVPDALGSESVEHAVVLGAFATVATTAAAHSEDAATLRRGLTSNRSIGQAIGILMALNDISDSDAFDILRKTSQTSNTKLVDVAATVIRERGLHETDKSA